MRYRDATAFRTALEQRLKDRAAGDGAQLVRDRKRVAFDRLLARLLTVAGGRWLLKGGFALDLRLAARARSTKAEWAVPFRRLAEEVGVPAELRVGHRDAAALLDPILGDEVTAGRWDPQRKHWSEP